MQFCGKNYWFCKFLFNFGIKLQSHCVVRKKSKQRIFLSWLLLIFFAAGQVIVYSHQHHTSGSAATKASHRSSHQTVSEKCQLCDAMHFNHMALMPQVYAQAGQVSYHLFAVECYGFVSLSLILSPGRAPPVS
jgi:hypothetical protein